MSVPKAGALAKASDWTTVFPLDTDAWTTYTPTLTQSATVTKTVTRAAYTKIGREVTVNGLLIVTGTGTAANNVIVGLPVTPVADFQVGSAFIYDSSATTRYICTCTIFGSTIAFQHDTSGASNFGVAPAVTLANNDQIAFSITYEAAS